MNKIFEVISSFFRRTFCCFSLVTIAMAAVGKLVSENEFSNYISVNLILSFLTFSLLFALSFLIADFVKNTVVRRFLQFVLTYASVAVAFFAGGAFENYVLTNAVQNKGFSILAISFVFVIIYVVCGIVTLVVSLVKSKLLNNNKEYKEMFENK